MTPDGRSATRRPGPDAAAPAPRRPQSLRRSSRIMVAGTLASRVTGFVRTVVIAAVLGSSLLADAYNVPNSLPNVVYDLLLGGILTSVVVPLLVEATERDPDEGQAYAQRLLTLVTVVLGAVSVLGILGAPLLVDAYTHFQPQARETAVTFTRFFLPQIVFYGIGATAGAVLNTRGSFGPPMWAPVLNNIVVIVTLVAYALLPGAPAGQFMTTAQTVVLGVGTTGGIAAQTVALWPALRATGFSWRARFDFRGVGLGHAGRLAGWMVVYVVAMQAAYLVVVGLATAAHAAAPGSLGTYSTYFYAYTLFQLPYAVVSVSVITALLPRMSRLAVGGQLAAVRTELARGQRYAGAVLVPAATATLALGPLVATVIFAHRHTSIASARYTGTVLAAFALGMVPFSSFQLQLRAFYAMRNTRTPALVAIAMSGVQIGLAGLFYLALPARQRIVGLALAHAGSYVAGLTIASVLLHRRLPGGSRDVVRTYVRLFVAAVVGTLVARVLASAVTSVAGDRVGGSALALLIAVPIGAVAYVLLARRLRVDEVTEMVDLGLGRLGRWRRRREP